MKLNTVIAGKYEDKRIFSCFGNLYILTGFMKWKKLNFDSFKRYKILKKIMKVNLFILNFTPAKNLQFI